MGDKKTTKPTIKPLDMHATVAADGGMSPQDMHATGEEVAPQDMHATDEPVVTKDMHATSEPFKPTKN
ncbi:hypothetical protein ACWCP6_07220 [Streptomyces sp. NPDC002004]